MTKSEKPLAIASRVCFGIHYPVQYNVKVKDLGSVHQDWLPILLGYWRSANNVKTQQSSNETNVAAQDEYPYDSPF